MGGAVRWFKALFGTKKRLSSGDGSDKGCCNLPTDTVCLRPFLSDTEKEQNKHTVAAVTTTALSAETAVTAAKEMAILTGEGKAGDITTREERWAAMKIQKVFRGSLARKALRALKGIVKLQALVRGYLVRKRAAAMLHSIQAMIRVQTAVRSKRNRCHKKEYKNMFQPRRSFDKFDEVVHDDVFKRRPKPRQTHNVVAMSEYEEDGFVYRGSDLSSQNTPRLSSSSKFAKTPRLTSSSHHHTANNNRYYVMQSPPGKSVCGNALCDYGTSSPGYMENTQSFKAKQRSHSAPHRRSERKRLSLDEVIAIRSNVSGESSIQQQQQRFSCSSNMIF